MNISDLINNPHKLEEVFREALDQNNIDVTNLLVDYIKDPWLIYEYSFKIKKDKVSDKLEDVIAKDAASSYYYALNVLHQPFPKSEDVIAKDLYFSYYYAKHVLRQPFPKGEDTIAKDAWASYNYAESVLHGPFPKGEETIAKDSYWSYLYAKKVLKGPFLKGEDTILKSKYKDKYIDFLKEIGELEEFYKRHPEVKK